MYNHNPFTYITFKELMASIKQDLKLFDNASLIDEDNLIKTVRYCNERLGDRTRKTEYKIIDIKNFKGELPKDFYKVVECFLLRSASCSTYPQMPILHTTKVHIDTEPPACTQPTAGKMFVSISDCCNYVYATESHVPSEDCNKETYHICSRMKLGFKFDNTCISGYEHYEKDGFEIDLVNKELETGIRDGKILFIYLADLDGEDVLIPQHPLLSPYYEYTLKEKILEDLVMNSEADVTNKLQYISSKKPVAWEQANNYLNSSEVDQFYRIRKSLQQKYYDQWYSKFN